MTTTTTTTAVLIAERTLRTSLSPLSGPEAISDTLDAQRGELIASNPLLNVCFLRPPLTSYKLLPVTSLKLSTNLLVSTKPKMAACATDDPDSESTVQIDNRAGSDGVGLGADSTPSRRASPEQANDVVARGMQKNVGFGRYNNTTHLGLRLRKTLVAATATTPSTELAAHASTVDTPLRLRESPIADTAITTSTSASSAGVNVLGWSNNEAQHSDEAPCLRGSDPAACPRCRTVFDIALNSNSAVLSECQPSSTAPSTPSTHTSYSGNTAAAVPECAVVSVAAPGPPLASSREQELVNGHANTIPASPPPSYSIVLETSRTNPSRTNPSRTNPSCTNFLVEDHSYPVDGDALPSYVRWEDIPPIYATLRGPSQPCMTSRTPSPSPPPSPSPKPSRISKRIPFSERYNLDPEAMEAAARAKARKTVDAELAALGIPRASSRAGCRVPSTV
ncbi:hypothetical protein CALVIDRAFT_565768 [Calocera viscosa TUFC12733]|uniref:Uncharacterized protein n=1 Tax=Calocera viscosa (strain TUFC12733) TaxID=1330018 RepID=A0A167K9J5_CALVF|nr:hypothetical protein CALVIDRAFT_565768 [Calocera viscosa TUFC12733]